MKKRAAQKLLDEAILSLGDTLSRLTFDAMFILSTYVEARDGWEERMKLLKAFSQKVQEKTGKEVYRSMWSRLIASDARVFPPGHVLMNPHGAKDEELLVELENNLNRQCNWLFVVAYEAYEKYLKLVHAALGYLDRRFWLCSEFGQIPLSEINRLPSAWFREQVFRGRTRITPFDLLNRIRMILPRIRSCEDSLDLRMWVGTAAFLRHVTVHNGGLTPREIFWDRVSEHTGYSFKGRTTDTAMRIHSILRYVETSGEDYAVTMIDRKALVKKGGRATAPLSMIIERLASHALLVYSSLAGRFQFAPYWERKGISVK